MPRKTLVVRTTRAARLRREANKARAVRAALQAQGALRAAPDGIVTFFCAWQDVSDAVLLFLRASDLSALEASAALSRFRNRSRSCRLDGPVASPASLGGEASVAPTLAAMLFGASFGWTQRCVCGWMAIRLMKSIWGQLPNLCRATDRDQTAAQGKGKALPRTLRALAKLGHVAIRTHQLARGTPPDTTISSLSSSGEVAAETVIQHELLPEYLALSVTCPLNGIHPLPPTLPSPRPGATCTVQLRFFGPGA